MDKLIRLGVDASQTRPKSLGDIETLQDPVSDVSQSGARSIQLGAGILANEAAVLKHREQAVCGRVSHSEVVADVGKPELVMVAQQ